MKKKYLDLCDIDAYQRSFQLSNLLWPLVLRWDYFSRDTVGKQFVRAIDSISANIAEGFGRYHKRDKIHFYRYAYGSIQESIDWVSKSRSRKLLSDDQCNQLLSSLKNMLFSLHHLIKFTDEKLTQ